MAAAVGSPNGPRIIKASEFKARCLKLMDEVNETGEEIIVTKNGRPTARLVPYRPTSGTWFGADRDIIQILGDLDEPLDAVWEAEQGLLDGR